MRFVDFPSLLDSEPADLALLSTFNFDPDYFERRLLQAGSLKKARRIAVFMDAGQWEQLRLQDAPARWVNRRYLLVPVHQPAGVFHPKLHLLLADESGQVVCGSNNLTRAGCSHNLELLNSVRWDSGEGDGTKHAGLVRSALRFFEVVAGKVQGEPGRVVTSWIKEEKVVRRWFDEPANPAQGNDTCCLVHTLDGSLWGRLLDAAATSPPNRILVISPYYDLDATMFKRIQTTWPECRLEVVAQQHTSNLPVAEILSARIPLELREVGCRPRRLHAKLLAWDSNDRGGCFVGSANFTSAAWDGRNVEACLLMRDPQEMIDRLFDSQLTARHLKPVEFVAGAEREPQPLAPDSGSATLSLRSASLTRASRLRVEYHCAKELGATALTVAIRAAGEHRPRAAMVVPVAEEAHHVVQLESQLLADIHGAIMLSLVARLPQGERESSPIWLIQEDRLTYEPSDSDAAHGHSAVVENGFGIPEYLEELGRREGAQAVVEFLNHLAIHFHDGSKGLARRRKFRVRQSDPFHPDVLPEWWVKAAFPQVDLQNAIFQFVRRHEDRQLKKHARRGNINGMENFLDILMALVRLLYVYRVRGVVERDRFVWHLGRCLDIATVGIQRDYDSSEGYLLTLSKNLSGDIRVLQEVADELNFAGYLNAVLLIAQMASPAASKPKPITRGKQIGVYRSGQVNEPAAYSVLSDDGGQWDSTAGRATGTGNVICQRLPELCAALNRGLTAARLTRPATDRIVAALESFEMLSERELASYKAALPPHT